TQKKSPLWRFFYSLFLHIKSLYYALRPSPSIGFGPPFQLGLQFNTSRRVICAKNPLFRALKTSICPKRALGLAA
ncbi:hypothetical protein, partial [Alcaligenes faecalis]|uniref:hypothetical protein n=1 Tax=Alcaligenes faecalis TaxID=511 RepID=UPI001E630602